jgi:hypothetical protein
MAGIARHGQFLFGWGFDLYENVLRERVDGNVV